MNIMLFEFLKSIPRREYDNYFKNALLISEEIMGDQGESQLR